MWIKRSHTMKLSRMAYTWIKPKGHDTGIKVFNCITKTKEPLVVRDQNMVTWYTCGPTVYDSSHIGHACCFVKLDILQRILRNYFGLNLVSVMNITDIDDKIISRANILKLSPNDVTTKYEKEFWRDLGLLNVIEPDCILRVTENIELIQKFIKKLIDKDQAYQSDDGSVYFDVRNFRIYGKLQNVPEEVTTENDSGRKRSAMDFALWKSQKPNEISWDSPWGLGRPGWHIECSALATHAFGSCIDIHAGGIDLRFPHHENEEAQSCAFHDKPQWVNYWLHTGHLHLKQDATKMSKSLKNTISVQELLDNYPADVFRLACAMSHYRTNFEYSTEFLTTASNVLNNYKNFIDTCRNYSKGMLKTSIDVVKVKELMNKSHESIMNALQDDFNTPNVIRALNDILTGVNTMLHTSPACSSDNDNFNPAPVIAASNLVDGTLKVFGINVDSRIDGGDVVMTKFSDVMDVLNDFRQEVRCLAIGEKNQNILKLCDSVRVDLSKNGIVIKDHGKKSSWSA